MRKRMYKNGIILFILLIISDMYGQGIQRSTGIGLKISYWNILKKPIRVYTSDYSGQVDVEIGGAGAYLCFISRAYENIFFELQLGAISGVTVNTNEFNKKNDVYVESIIPLLFGLRYDFLSSKLTGSIHPYISLAAGPYWLNKVKTIENVDIEGRTVDEKTEVNTDLLYGGYLGAGTNILISNWFALNFDLRYQFVEFQYDQGYSGTEFIMGFNFLWGKKREIYEIKDIKLVIKDIYPAYRQFYMIYPVALISIKNKISEPFDVRIISRIRHFKIWSSEGEFYQINGGDIVDIPVNLFLGDDFQSWDNENNVTLEFKIEIKYTSTLKKELSLPILIHSCNAWNGDIDKLRYFITPENNQVREFSRMSIFANGENDEPFSNLDRARILFNKLKEENIRYLADPNIPGHKNDRVQYAHESLNYRSGDCDDLVVLYSSLLESIGIKTAFVEVKDPQKEIAHVYLIFDSGFTVSMSQQISNNEKKFIVREHETGEKRIWIPVETTLISKGFEEAWDAGALAYLEEAILRSGIAEKWVKIIDVN